MVTLREYSANLVNLSLLSLKPPAAVSSIGIEKTVMLEKHTIHKCIIHNHHQQIVFQNRFLFAFVLP